MRAKQVQILKIGKNYSISTGANSILYNLAFSPKIAYIDFSDDYIGNTDTAEALYKLIKISGSLETLILKNTSVNNLLKEEFFIALGENKTLQFLNLDATTAMTATNLNLLGKACAMNKKKNGTLKYLSLEACFGAYSNLDTFLNSFKISDYDAETWYGDKKIAKDMEKEQLEKKFEFGLSYFNIGRSNIMNNNFKLKDY